MVMLEFDLCCLGCWTSVGALFGGCEMPFWGIFSQNKRVLCVWLKKFESTPRKGTALACVGAIFVNIVGLYRQQIFLLKWGYYYLPAVLGNG
jgi:hypothetical protein